MFLATGRPIQVFKYDLSFSFFETDKSRPEARGNPEHC